MLYCGGGAVSKREGLRGLQRGTASRDGESLVQNTIADSLMEAFNRTYISSNNLTCLILGSEFLGSLAEKQTFLVPTWEVI